MSSTIVAIAVIIASCAVHARARRHAGWTASARGRFLMLLGYPSSAVAAYWLTTASTGWEWVLGVGWAVAAAACFTAGVAALRCVTVDHAARAVAMETIEPATGALRF
ncbi:hypothetical protein [Mycolicibacterium gilvum]|uniref:Transmembrane protein n=1 Tax=Mycolicibacterium gilvum (strain PYR-GCK) TaxID=350054 RepID=A4TF62_MYCGI|nr:hypothetical protein Mflv_4739 [Mycolicibacterium gilvum PYR-GCK]